MISTTACRQITASLWSVAGRRKKNAVFLRPRFVFDTVIWSTRISSLSMWTSPLSSICILTNILIGIASLLTSSIYILTAILNLYSQWYTQSISFLISSLHCKSSIDNRMRSVFHDRTQFSAGDTATLTRLPSSAAFPSHTPFIKWTEVAIRFALYCVRPWSVLIAADS